MKRLACALLALCLLGLPLAGCDTLDSPPTAASQGGASSSDTPVKGLPARIEAEEIVELKNGDKIDLDGDGTAEALRLEEGADENHLLLTAGDSQFDIYTINPTGKFYAASLGNDSSIQLLVTEDGPSSDPASYLFQYANGKLWSIGVVAGHAPEFIRTPDGFLTTGRGQLLETWYHTKEYVLATASSLMVMGEEYIPPFPAEVPVGTHPVGTIVRLKRSLPLLETTDAESPVRCTIDSGALVSLSASDDREWVYIEAVERNGTLSSGWMRIKPGSYDTCLIDGSEVNAEQLFAGRDLYD